MRFFLIGCGILIVAGLSFVTYNFSNNSNPMVGTWEMKSGVYLGPDGTPSSLSGGAIKQVKVINDTHFTTIWEDTNDDSNRGHNGGIYTFIDGIYTEYLEYFTISDRVGDTAYFKVEIKEDIMSVSACDKEGNISKTGYFQVYQKVE